MSNVVNLHGNAVNVIVQNELRRFDEALVLALERLKRNDVPQGLIVAILHAHTTQQTLEMLE